MISLFSFYKQMSVVDVKKFYDFNVVASGNTTDEVISKSQSVYKQFPVLVKDVLQMMRWAVSKQGMYDNLQALEQIEFLNQASYKNLDIKEDTDGGFSEGGYFHVQLYKGKLKAKDEINRIYSEESKESGLGLGLGLFLTSPKIKALSEEIRERKQQQPYSFMERTIIEKPKQGRPPKVLTAAERLAKNLKKINKLGGGQYLDNDDIFDENSEVNSSLTDILKKIKEIDAQSEFMTIDSNELKRLFPTVLKGGEPIVVTEEITFKEPLIEPQVEMVE
jgi:hypothetical protein